MKPIALSKLLYTLYDTPLYSDVLITGLSADSRKVQPGDLFFACRGEKKDGRQFILQAIDQGAKAVLVEASSHDSMSVQTSKEGVPLLPLDHLEQHMGPIAAHFYDYPSQKLHMIGITGTNGKTSCSHFMAKALQTLNQSCGVIGTLGSGLYGQLQNTGFTTPPPLSLQRILADFVNKKTQYVVMEVSSHSLEQGRVNGIKFGVSVFTNLSRDHLDYHGDMVRYGNAKKKLFTPAFTEFAVFNIDDPFGADLAKTGDTSKTLTYSIANPAAHIYTRTRHLSQNGMQMHLVTPWGTGQLSLPLMGEFNLSNVLAAFGTLGLLHFPFKDLLQSFGELTPVPGRMQTFGGGDQPLVIVDYAHTPDALEKVLSALRVHCEKKLLCLFGCGGDRDAGKRPEMARIAERLADIVMVTDDNPRQEDPGQIMHDIFTGFVHPENVRREHDRSLAIQEILMQAKQGDCVLIAGKGAENYQYIGDQMLPFSDGAKVMEILHAGLA